MAQYPGSIPYTGYVAPASTTDVYAVTDERFNRGGYRTVADETARLAITSDRRAVGMLVKETSTGIFWTLVGGITDSHWQISTIVDTMSNQTIEGIKTFNTFPLTPSSFPTTDYQVANKKYVDSLSNSGDFLDRVLKMQEDNTLDPGLTPHLYDRYIILNASSLHTNFGTISGLGNNDIVEYNGSAFTVVYDTSAAMQPATVTVGTDKNGNTNHQWTYNVTDDIWVDRGAAASHNSLDGLNDGDYHHLTAAQYTNFISLTDGSDVSNTLHNHNTQYAIKQSSIIDTASGRGMIVGAFGLGNTVYAPFIDDYKNYYPSGFYLNPNTAADIPFPNAYASTIVNRYNSTIQHYLSFNVASDGAIADIRTSQLRNGVLSPWVTLYHTGNLTGDVTSHNHDSRYSRKYSSAVNINSTTYTNVALVDGSNLGSTIRLFVKGVSGNVVINSAFEILVNHSQDIVIKSTSGGYTQLLLKVDSNSNEDYNLSIKRVGGSGDTPVNISVIDEQGQGVTLFTNNPALTHTATTHEHQTKPFATNITATGGVVAQAYIYVNSNEVYNAGNANLSTVNWNTSNLNTYGKLYLGITTPPVTDTGTLNALVWDNTTGEVKQRAITGTSSQWVTSGSDIYYNSGNVGIGTITSTTDQLLINLVRGAVGNSALRVIYQDSTTVLGEAAFLACRNGVWSNLYLSGSGSSNSYGIYVDGTKPNYFAGNVGIGTDNPLSELHLNNNKRIVTIRMGAVDNYLYEAAIRTRFVDNAGSYLELGSYHGNSTFNNFLSIAPSGNVGIGRIPENRELEVEGTIYPTGYYYSVGRIGFPNGGLILQNNGTGQNLELRETASSLYAFQNSAGGATIIQDLLNLRVGIGRIPTTYKCEIEGSSLITNKLYLGTSTAPTIDTGTLNALVWDNTTGEVKQRAITSFDYYQTSITSSPAPAPVGSHKENEYYLTALAAIAKFAAPSGTPVNGNTLLIRIKDNGTARTLAWNSIYRAVGVTLPTTTTASRMLYIGCIYNGTDSKWDVVSVVEQA